VYSQATSKININFKMKHYPVQGFGLIKFLQNRNTFLRIASYFLFVKITKRNRIILL